jgi:ABC-2 type transport system ATP-binding protein
MTLAIEAKALSKIFSGQTVVDRLSIEVEQGSIYGFLGPNGSGKTTSIRMLCGLLTPDSGSGKCLGLEIGRDAARIKQLLGYMPQRFGLYEDLTIEENLLFIARLYEVAQPHATVQASLERLGLAQRAHQLAGMLSGGWKQRLALAACTLHAPRLLLLDEPTAGVDPEARRGFWDEIHAIAAGGVTVLVSTHYMDEAERCHMIGYLFEGRMLLHGTVEQVIAGSGLSAYRLTGRNLIGLEIQAKALPGVELATGFGAELRICGHDSETLKKSLEGFASTHALVCAPIAPSLEDVFIDTITHARAAAHAK